MKIQENISLKEYNTFGIDKKARFFVQAKEVQDIRDAIDWSRKHNLSLFILGGGSNVLLTHDLQGLILKIDIQGISVIRESAENVWLKAGAGVIWQKLVDYAINKGWSGIENLSWIPGTVGASPMQNIGAYGAEISEVFDHLEAINKETLQTEIFNNEACCFGYRESVFKNKLKDKYIISHVILRLNKHPHFNTSYGDIENTLAELGLQPNIKTISEAVIYIRKKKLPDPTTIGNAGSFFKNPYVPATTYKRLKENFPKIPGYVTDHGIKIPAAWLIDQAGWKGKRFGNVGVHHNQPLVLVNYGGAEGEDILELSRKIQEDIFKKFGISLQREVNVV